MYANRIKKSLTKLLGIVALLVLSLPGYANIDSVKASQLNLDLETGSTAFGIKGEGLIPLYLKANKAIYTDLEGSYDTKSKGYSIELGGGYRQIEDINLGKYFHKNMILGGYAFLDMTRAKGAEKHRTLLEGNIGGELYNATESLSVNAYIPLSKHKWIGEIEWGDAGQEVMEGHSLYNTKYRLTERTANWGMVAHIMLSWVICPIIAGIVAYFLFLSIQRLIFSRSSPINQIKKYFPFYMFFIGLVLSQITVVKAINSFIYTINLKQNILIAVAFGFILLFFGNLISKRIPKIKCTASKKDQFIYVEKIFAVLMFFTACAMVYAHGSNDVAISVGPICAIINFVRSDTSLNYYLVSSILGIGAIGVVIGLLTYGQKIIKTVGSKITYLTPSRAYCATFSAAAVVVISTSAGIPISATQTLVGGIFGVGLARGIGAIDLRVIRNILTSWIITIPITALLTVVFFVVIKSIFI